MENTNLNDNTGIDAEVNKALESYAIIKDTLSLIKKLNELGVDATYEVTRYSHGSNVSDYEYVTDISYKDTMCSVRGCFQDTNFSESIKEYVDLTCDIENLKRGISIGENTVIIPNHIFRV